MDGAQGARERQRPSLFASDTLAGLRAAHDEARRAVQRREPSAAEALDRCEKVACGVAAAERGETATAGALIDDGVRESTDLRLLFLAFQFHFRTSSLDAAEAYVHRRLSAAPAGSPDAARAWDNLGLILFFRGDLGGAEEMSKRALAIDRAIGCEHGEARDLGNLAMIPEARGEYDEAERLYRESLAIAERIGATPIAASKLANLGDVALARGRRDEARSLWTRARGLFESLGDRAHQDRCDRQIAALDGPVAP